MCEITQRSPKLTEFTGYKVVFQLEDSFYSIATGIKYNVGEQLYGISRVHEDIVKAGYRKYLWYKLGFSSKEDLWYNALQDKHNLTSVFINKKDAFGVKKSQELWSKDEVGYYADIFKERGILYKIVSMTIAMSDGSKLFCGNTRNSMRNMIKTTHGYVMAGDKVVSIKSLEE
jgi:hypothetical protein